MNLKKLLFGRKYYVVFLMKQNETYVVLSRVRIKESKSKIEREDKTYPIAIENPTYVKEKEVFYLIDISSGQLKFGENKKLDSSYFELVNSICDKQIVNDLTQDLIEKPSLADKILFIATGLGLGLFIGIIVGQILSGVI